jgi:hypothetical protein
MFTLDNEVFYSDRELAEQAYQDCVERGLDVERHSFIQGYLTALKEQK